MDKNEIQIAIERITSTWREEQLHLKRLQEELEELTDLINEAENDIGLLEEAVEADSQEDNWDLEDNIEELYQRRDELIGYVEEKKSKITEINETLNKLRDEASRLEDRLQVESRKFVNGTKRIRRAGRVGVSYGSERIHRELVSGYQFCQDMLKKLCEVFGPCDAYRETGELEYIPEPSSGESVPSVVDKPNGLRMIGSQLSEVYATQDASRSLRCHEYTVCDTIDSPGPEASKDAIGRAAVEYATALLNELGHVGVLAIGNVLPDVMSVDNNKKLTISEIKGTATPTNLASSGLKRKVKADVEIGMERKTTLMENSPAWLLYKSNDLDRPMRTLKAIDDEIVKENNASRKEELRTLRESYREAVRCGFNPLVCDRQLVQVGFLSEGASLRPPTDFRSKAFDEYIRAAEPSRIIQINVVRGSKDAPGFMDDNAPIKPNPKKIVDS
ncbi:MAG: hypothetical protein JXA30_22225 [Deltaproteobacteria bacterium]|nr:hypothetical protein [Deltaproteobacteria bacterium]